MASQKHKDFIGSAPTNENRDYTDIGGGTFDRAG